MVLGCPQLGSPVNLVPRDKILCSVLSWKWGLPWANLSHPLQYTVFHSFFICSQLLCPEPGTAWGSPISPLHSWAAAELGEWLLEMPMVVGSVRILPERALPAGRQQRLRREEEGLGIPGVAPRLCRASAPPHRGVCLQCHLLLGCKMMWRHNYSCLHLGSWCHPA